MTTECTLPVLPVAGCLAPSASPTSSPSPSPAPTATAAPAPAAAQPPPVVSESPATTALAPISPPAPAAVVPAPVALASPTTVPLVVQASASPAAATGLAPLSGVVASSFALVVFGLIGIALLVSFLSGLRPAVTRSPSYGGTMNRTRTRLWAGLGVIALAAVVGGIGWYRISGEPLLNRQIPFLASAGIAVVVLAVLGAALIVAEQLRTDQNRIGELEQAVRSLTDALAPIVENPARRGDA